MNALVFIRTPKGNPNMTETVLMKKNNIHHRKKCKTLMASGKLFSRSVMVFLKEFLKRVDFEKKKISVDDKSMQNYPGGK